MIFEDEGKTFRLKLLTRDTRVIAHVFLAWTENHPEDSNAKCRIVLLEALMQAKMAGLEPYRPASEMREQQHQLLQ